MDTCRDRAWPSHNLRRVSATCDNEGAPRRLGPGARTSAVSQLTGEPRGGGVLVTCVSERSVAPDGPERLPGMDR